MRIHTVLFTVFVLSACNGEATPTDDTDMPVEMTDEEIAADLWMEIDGFDMWSQVAPWEGVVAQADGSPHGPYVQIWLNSDAAGAVSDVQDGGTFPDGSILVKRLYDTDQESSVQAPTLVMKKIDGYAGTDWFWAMYTDDQGSTDTFGDVAMCTGCHVGGLDYSRVLTDVPGPAM